MAKKIASVPNQVKIRNAHINEVYNIFCRGGSYCCTDIAKMLGLSNTAVANILEEMLFNKIIYFTENSQQGAMGRPSIMYQINPNYGVVAAVDLTDTELVISLANMKMRILKTVKIPNILYIDSKIIQQVLDVIRNFALDKEYSYLKLKCICIGTPGKIDRKTGFFSYAPKYIDYKTVNLHDIFFNEFNVEVVIKNDVKLALIGESFFGNAENLANIVFLHIDHNYGGAIMVNGKILDGEHGFAGELGGMRILNKSDEFKYSSYCISIGGMIYNMENLMRADGEQPPKETSIAEFLSRYKNQDKYVSQVVAESAEITALEILNLITLFDTPNIILDGRIRFFGSEYLDRIKETIDKYNFDKVDINICYSALRGRATILGGIRTAIDVATKKILNAKS